MNFKTIILKISNEYRRFIYRSLIYICSKQTQRRQRLLPFSEYLIRIDHRIWLFL